MKKSEEKGWVKMHLKLLVIIMLASIDLMLCFVVFQFQHRVLTVSFLNVGQGDAVFIEAPNGNQMLYDAGPPSGAVLRELSQLMPFWDRTLDVLVLSHPDLDHIGGALDVLKRYHVDVVLESGASSTNRAFAEEEQLISSSHIPEFIAREHMSIDLGGGVFADILYPDVVIPNEDTNDASIVLRIRYGSTSFLVSGDLPKSGEALVLQFEHGHDIHADVLKLGHHGSRTSSSEAWLSAIHPSLAIISAGLNNRYGHPHKEVLDLLAQMHIPYLATYSVGTITFKSDGKRVEKK